MAGAVSDNVFSAGCAPEATILNGRESIWGRLDSIAESEGTILADIEGARVELPGVLSTILLPLIGQRVIVGIFDGEYHAGRCSA